MPSATQGITDIANAPEIYTAVFPASRWLFAFFALMLLAFAFAWHFADRRERRNRLKNLPGAGTVGELVVLSGSSDLPVNTWFPVPREGVLGSVRSCDLVVPCGGVRSRHLDFSWQDGTGLLVRPRFGCDALVDGMPVSRGGAYAGAPMRHGSVLQVGDAVLRLQLFSALSDTNRSFTPQAPAAVPGQDPSLLPPQQPVYGPCTAPQPLPWPGPRDQGMIPAPPVPPADGYPQEQPFPEQFPPDQPAAVPEPGEQEGRPDPEGRQLPPRRKRADRWKEDWSE